MKREDDLQDSELDKFANRFINLWQENFSKAIEDREIINYMMQATSNMQQFYDKSPAAAFTVSRDAGDDELRWRQLNGRLDAIERRLDALEKPKTGARKKNKTGSKK